MSFLHSKCEKEISEMKQKIQKTESEMKKLNDQLAEVKTKKESEIKKLKKELNNLISKNNAKLDFYRFTLDKREDYNIFSYEIKEVLINNTNYFFSSDWLELIDMDEHNRNYYIY